MVNHTDKKEKYYVRLNKIERFQHYLLMLSIGILVMTGFMLEGEKIVIEFFGGAAKTIFYWRGILHRIAAIMVMCLGAIHIYYILFVRSGRSWIWDMLPRFKDAKDAVQNVGYLIGLRGERPKFDRFTYAEKLEYFSIYIGMPIVIVSGIMLWTQSSWNRFYLDIAEAFHRGEATLAALAIMVWHIITVFFKPGNYPLNTTFIHGMMSEDDIKHHHPLWYERLRAEEEAEAGGKKEGDALK